MVEIALAPIASVAPIMVLPLGANTASAAPIMVLPLGGAANRLRLLMPGLMSTPGSAPAPIAGHVDHRAGPTLIFLETGSTA